MTIHDVAKKLNVTQDTLRFYEKSGLIGPIQRDKNGYRNYQENDVKRMEFIMCMRKADLSIDVLKQYMKLYDKGEETRQQRKELLIEQKNLLDDKIKTMQEASEALAYKIKLYEDGKLDEYLEKI